MLWTLYVQLTQIESVFRSLKSELSIRPIGHQLEHRADADARWLNDHLQAWLGEKNAADTLAQSVPNNVTSEMGLALLDVGHVIRPHQDVVTFLRRVMGQTDLGGEYVRKAYEHRDRVSDPERPFILFL